MFGNSSSSTEHSRVGAWLCLCLCWGFAGWGGNRASDWPRAEPRETGKCARGDVVFSSSRFTPSALRDTRAHLQLYL